MFQQIKTTESLDFDNPIDKRDPRFSIAPLYGIARGQMIGLLETVDSSGNLHYLKAFSGKFNGNWELKGWAPPLFDVILYSKIEMPIEKQIKALTAKIISLQEEISTDKERIISYQTERKILSQNLMKELHSLYILPDFKGNRFPLTELFKTKKGIPTGTGDCCGPKLLGAAANRGLKPISLAEFYIGKENRSKTRQEGVFYAPCREKCIPIIGSMLCGVENVSI